MILQYQIIFQYYVLIILLYINEDDQRYLIQNLMRNKDVISYLGLWESHHNKKFKGGEFATFKNEAGSNKFKMSSQK